LRRSAFSEWQAQEKHAACVEVRATEVLFVILIMWRFG
jgi:hypothetical protein